MGDNPRDLLLEMGLNLDDINKAIKHFGPGMTTETAVDWIFNGCPGYVDYAPPHLSQASHPAPNTQVVPYAGSHPHQQPSSNTGQSALQPHNSYRSAQQSNNDGWLHAFQEHNKKVTENDIASSMLALKDANNAGQNTAGNSNNNNRCRSDSMITQPAYDPWELHDSDIGRDYSKIPPTEDVPSSNYAATSNYDSVPTIDLTQADANGSKGLSAPRTSPIDPSMKSDSNSSVAVQGPQEEGDADLKRAIELSLQESTNNAAASTDMSRAASRSRAQQEEEELNQAMSQSMLYADQQASASFTKDQHSLDTKPREDPDVPVILASPSSFLAYLPSMLHTFYYNPTFRQMVLNLDIDYLQSPSFENYSGDKPILTRSLLPPQAPDYLVKLAALQRLFIFMSQSRRTKTGLTDIMDAFGIKVPNATRDRNPLSDMKALHDSVGNAWLQYTQAWLEDQVSKGTISQEEASSTSEQAKSVLFSQGISLPDITDAALETEPEPAFFGEGNPALQWSSCAALQTVPPELNDTYSALDEYFGHPERTAFIVKPGKALYIYNQRLGKSSAPVSAIGPAPPPYSTLAQADETPMPFKVEPELYLDRYAWKNRKQVMEMRRNIRAGQEQLHKLLVQRERLLTSSKNGKPLVTLPATTENGDMAQNEVKGTEGKAVLQQAIARLEELADTVEDPERQKSQAILVQKLKAIVTMMQSQIQKLNEEIAQTRQQISASRELGKQEIGPYELRTVVMWNGFMGRDSMYTYVRSGTATAEIDGQTIKNPKWWKVGGEEVFEVSQDDVLNDVTGIHMLGGGSIAQSYVSMQDSDEMAATGIPDVLVQAIEADNAVYLAEVEKNAPKQDINQGITTEGEGMAMDAAPADNKDDTMQTDEPATAVITSEPSKETLNLKGGASRRRMSISSDTGSIASTSRVRLDDWDDEEGSEGYVETVELGFPVKLKKAFKVVRDVGKLGGKPTWLDPALPLKPEMVMCETCNCRMEYLLQMNCPLDELPQAIYRTFYVYTCRKSSCLKNATSQGVKVYRVQLPDKNAYYELQDEAEQSRAQKFRDKQYAQLCPTCKMKHSDPCPCKPWNEWLIETGAEDVEDEEEAPITADEIEERMKNATLYKEELSAEDTAEPDTRTAVDAAFLKFQERLYNEPDQVLRYYYREKETEPLWVSDEKKSRPTSIPKCICGGERKVEFQIMPPILSILGVDDLDKDSLDFGTIIVYTCTDSCTVSKPPPESIFEGEQAIFTPPSGWAEEVGFVQNFSQQGVKFQGV